MKSLLKPSSYYLLQSLIGCVRIWGKRSPKCPSFIGGILIFCLCFQGVTKRCRLSWLTNTALYRSPNAGGGGGVAGYQPMSTAACVHGAQINFGDLTPYLTYGASNDVGCF